MKREKKKLYIKYIPKREGKDGISYLFHLCPSSAFLSLFGYVAYLLKRIDAAAESEGIKLLEKKRKRKEGARACGKKVRLSKKLSEPRRRSFARAPATYGCMRALVREFIGNLILSLVAGNIRMHVFMAGLSFAAMRFSDSGVLLPERSQTSSFLSFFFFFVGLRGGRSTVLYGPRGGSSMNPREKSCNRAFRQRHIGKEKSNMSRLSKSRQWFSRF